MPNPTEIATVVANGVVYRGWTKVQIERSYNGIVSHMRLTVAEQSSGSATGGANPELMPKDQAQGYLGGILVLSGTVSTRQVQYDKNSHEVLIIVASETQKLLRSTVDGKPGYYQGYPFSSIANAIANKVGVNVKVTAPGDAEKPFPRVSEHIGETRFACIARLAAVRNLYLVDDAKGTLLATRGTGGVVAELVEGRNIESAVLTLGIPEWTNPVRSVGVNYAGSLGTTDDEEARNVSATVTAPNMPTDAPATVVMDQPGDSQQAAMHVARVQGYGFATYIDGRIVCPGWFMDDGSLWIEHVGELVTIYSPMLAPGGNMTLGIQGVIHQQDSENGTQTVVQVCHPAALGGYAGVRSDGSAGGDPFGEAGTPVPGG